MTITVAPNDVGLVANATQQFTCTVAGSANTQSGWSVQPRAGGGTITASGLYTAPATTGLYTVIATSIADPSRSATAIARVAAPPGGGDNPVRPGLGNDPGMPLVATLNLPAGVRIDGAVIGADADGGECRDRDAVIGSGRAVRACVSICMGDSYVGTGPAEFRAEPGMMITSDTGDGQHGMVIEEVWITVPYTPCTGGYRPNESEEERSRRFIVELNAFCLNASRSPSFAGMRYTAAGVTRDADMRSLLALLATKRVQTEAHAGLVQEAIYAITESSGIAAGLWARLQSELPDAG